MEEAAAVAREIGDGSALARILRHVATFHMSDSAAVGGLEALQRDLLEEALAAARAAGDPRETGYILSMLSLLVFTQGDRSTGARMNTEALQLLRQVGDRDALSACLFRAGDLALAQGDLAAARTLLEEDLTAAREMDLGLGVLFALTWLGRTARADGDLAAARSHYVQALLVARDRGDRVPIMMVLRALGGWCVAAGYPARAARLFGAEAAARADAPIQYAPTAQPDPYEGDVVAAQAALGAATFHAAWTDGAAMPLDEAVAYALSDAVAERAATSA